MAFEPGSKNSRNAEEDTCHCQSICYQAVLRVKISLRDTFSKSGFPRVVKKLDGSGLKYILQELWTI